jgi:putative transposase
MPFLLRPWHILLICLAGWINRRQQETIEYLQAENQILKQKLGKKRIELNHAQRRLLAIKGKVLGRKALREIGPLFTPDTILRWHRELVAQKWDYSPQRKKPGRPRIEEEVVGLVIQIAQENLTWGYDRIQGALANLGYELSPTTIQNILHEQGIEPAPRRRKNTTWKAFLARHWEGLAAMDFTTLEVWTQQGLQTFYLLFVMEQSTRKVHLAGCTRHPTEAWMLQLARNLTDLEQGFLRSKRYLLLDRDSKYSYQFRLDIESAGPKCLLLPPKSPNLTPHMERFMRSIKEECLNRKIFFGEKSLRTALSEYLAHYHQERNHQGVGNKILEPGAEIGRVRGPIKCRERLGGLLRYYYREAA